MQLPELRVLLQRIVEKTGVPGISSALLCDGEITSITVGTASRFALGSTVKFLVCAAAMESMICGQLDPKAPLRTYLPELADCEMGNDVAVWHLMSHTSGCYQGTGGFLDAALGANADWERVIRRSISARRLFAPGVVFSYDTPNYVLCGEILRRLHGFAPRDLIRTRILEPLGIDAPVVPGSASQPWESATSSLTLSMPELVTIAAAIMGAPSAAATVLSVPAREMLFTQLVDLPVAPEWPVRDCAPVSYGFGCAAHRNGLLGHPGETSEQCCALHFDPVRQFAVAVGVNARAFPAREAALTMLMRAMGYSSESSTSKSAIFERDELPGDYFGGSAGRAFQVREQGSGLTCSLATPSTSGGSFPTVRFHMTDEGHVVLDESWRQLPICFFREPVAGVPGLVVGQTAYRRS